MTVGWLFYMINEELREVTTSELVIEWKEGKGNYLDDQLNKDNQDLQSDVCHGFESAWAI